jgi:16S rRNA (guanine527-N7)-methyltransferase
MEIIKKYFPEVSDTQIQQFKHLHEHIMLWNDRINVISRKDTDAFLVNHLLHSLAIARFTSFNNGTNVLDIGTGGGFPGLPLAIMFPEVNFHLVDSIGKKIKVVDGFIKESGLKNATAEQVRAENLKEKYDFVVSRAVTAMPKFLGWTRNKISQQQKNTLKNGIIALKGGDLKEEFAGLKYQIIEEPVSQWFDEPFFESKKVIYIPIR